MLFEALLQRVLIVILYQSLIVIYQSYFAYRLIKRAKNPMIFTLASFFITSAIAYIFPLFSLIFINTPLGYIFYLLTWIVGIFSHSFLIIFSWELAHLENPIKLQEIIPFFIPYSVMLFLIIWAAVFLGGIRYDSQTGWIPTFTWDFAIFSWITFTVFMILPQSIISIVVVKKFKGESIRKRIISYIFSVLIEFLIIMLLILYNTWTDNVAFRILYFVITAPSSYLAAFLIYKAFVQGLR